MSSPSVVRAAVPGDENEIWRLFRLHHQENALFRLSEPKVQFYLDRVLHPERIANDDGGPRGLIGVIGEVGALEGAIMLILGSPWYTEDITLDDCMNFVDPDHRRTDHAKSLIAYAKHLVDLTRPVHHNFRMIVGIVSTKQTAAKMRLYERQMEQVGAYYMYPPERDMMPLKNTHRNI